MKYLIIGGRKCGSTSLEVYLNMQGYNVLRREQLFTNIKGFETYENQYPDYKLVLILRNPIDRTYSDWKYAIQEKRTELNYRDYCLKIEGVNNPLRQSNYKEWFKNWNLKMYIMTLEDMQKIPNFPKLNNVDGEMSKEDRQWTKDRLDEM